MSNTAQKRAPGVSRIISASSISEETKNLCREKLNSLLIRKIYEYPNLSREEGVNFNPLPARFLEILLREGKIYEEASLFSALELSLKHPREFSDTVAPDSAKLAWALDILRHMHQMELALDEKSKLLSDIENFLASFGDEKIERRLYQLASHALKRIHA